MRMLHVLLGLTCIVFIAGTFGCGPRGKGLKVEYVEGVITFDDQIVSQASVTFIPLEDKEGVEAAGGVSNDKGVYKLTSGNGDPEKGALPGEYRVIVSKIETKSKNSNEGGEYVPTSGYQLSYTVNHLLPEIYRDRDKSPLTVTVKKGKNTIPLELKKNP